MNNTEIISIRPLTIDDTPYIIRWRNSPSVNRYLFNQDKLTSDQHIAYFKNVIEGGKCFQFIIDIEYENMKKSIGTTFIKNIDKKNHTGEFGIFIGEEIERGKGYATAATRLIVDYGFRILELHRIYLNVMSDNYPAINVYNKVGFIREGVLRESFLRFGEYIDIVSMSILKQEWEKLSENNKVRNVIS